MKKTLLLLSMGLMALTSLNSCNKDSKGINEEPKPTPSVQKIPFEMAAEASVEGMPLIELDDELVSTGLRARLTMMGYDKAPIARFKSDDFGNDGKLAVHWAVMGAGKSMKGHCDKAYASHASAKTDLDAKKAVVIIPEVASGKQRLSLSVGKRTSGINGELGTSVDAQGKYTHNHYAYMAIGGYENENPLNQDTDWTRLYFVNEFKHNKYELPHQAKTAPNRKVEGLAIVAGQTEGDKGLMRHIPFMTDLTPVEVKYKKETLGAEQSANLKANFKPRGSLIGLRLVNLVEREIEIDEIIVEKNNTINVEGYFDWKDCMNKNVAVDLKENPTKVPFTALNSEIDHRFPIFKKATDPNDDNTATRGVTLPYIKDINATQKSALPCFYFWGFQDPNKVGDALKIKVRYRIPQSDPTAVRHAVTTKTITITAPQGGFKDGVAYRLTVDLNIPYHRKPKSMLGLLAERNMFPQGQQGIQTSHARSKCYKLSDAVFILEGPLPGNPGNKFDSGEYLRGEGYEMPRRLTMARIFPTAMDSIAYNGLLLSTTPNQGNIYSDNDALERSWLKFSNARNTIDKRTVTQGVEYLNGENTQVEITYRRVRGTNNAITYALKFFKGHPDYVSAWRYTWEENPDFEFLHNAQGLPPVGSATRGYGVKIKEYQIKVNAIDDIPVLNFDDIAKEDFWNDPNKTIVERYLPASGYQKSADATLNGAPAPEVIQTYGRQGLYWVMDYPLVLSFKTRYQPFCLYFDKDVAVISKFMNIRHLALGEPATITNGDLEGLPVRPIKKTATNR